MDLYEFLEKCDAEKIIAFPMHIAQINKKSEKDLTTITIPLPKNVIDKNLMEIHNYIMYAIVIPKQEYNRIIEEG